MPRIVLATRNAGKIRELREMLAQAAIEVVGLDAFGDLPDVEETGDTFVDNARLKARAVAAATGLPALADDSGLCVDALGGRPGVQSARYGGPGLADAERVDRLLAELGGRASRGRFCCAMVLALPGGRERVIEAAWEGVIAGPPRGDNGFGYDPVFEVPGTAQTAAELAPAEKHRLSHRGQALAGLLALLAAEPGLLD